MTFARAALRRLALLPLLSLAVLAWATAAQAVDEADLLPVDEAFALTVEAEAPDVALFTFAIAEGYYLYRHRFAVEPLDAGSSAAALDIPPGEAGHDEFFGDVETYRQQVRLRLPGIQSAGRDRLRFHVQYQGCADVGICYPPQKREISLNLPASPLAASATVPASPLPGSSSGGLLSGLPGSAPPPGMAIEAAPLPPDEAFQFEAIASSPTELLLRLTPAPGYYLYRDKTTLRLLDAEDVHLGTPAWPAGTAHHDEHFGDVQVFFDQIEAPLGLRRSRGEAGTLALEVSFQGCQTDGICYPPMTRTLEIALPQAAADHLVSLAPDAPISINGTRSTGAAAPALNLKTVLLALLGALGGGLILNLMPCVLPVLSLKVLGLVESGESHAKARRHALWYTAGVLSGFAALGLIVLALRQLGMALGWGFQLQQPWLVAALAYLMAAVGLSLSGVFTMGAGMAGVGHGLASRSGATGDFFTGLLAVVVASPCTAPLMGPALAFAFTAHPALALSVFLALGLGLALPFLLIGFIPAWARVLPRPGAWMESLKQFLAFPMYLTAVWLLWVLGQQRGVDALAWALAGIVLLALALWRWEKTRWSGSLPGRALAIALAALALWPLWQIPHLQAPAANGAVEDGDSVAYSPARLESLRAEGRTIFINMTADWCVTCKANEQRLFNTDVFRDLLHARNVVYMKGDWTDVNAEIAAFLETHGAVGVPLYVVVKPGQPDTVLSTMPTLGAVKTALGAP